MSVVLGHTRWPDNISSLVSSQTSLIRENTPKSSDESMKLNPNYTSKSHPIIASTDSRDQSRYTKSPSHKRPASCLFDIIYDESPTKSHNRPVSADITSDQLKSPSYIEIEKAILAGHALGSSDTSPNAPTVTMIDGGNLRRSGSVVSHSAGLRHRNTIQRRNKMARRSSPVQNAHSSSSVFSTDSETKTARKTKARKSKVFPIFPARRRTSYKYYPVTKMDGSSRFNSPKDVDDFFMLGDVASLMKDILPKTMLSFEFQKLLRPKPHLVSRSANFNISRDAQFTTLDPTSKDAQTSKFVSGNIDSHANRGASTSTDTDNSTTSKDSDLIKRKAFLTEVHENYRRITFAGKRKVPLTLETVLPRESEMMTSAERNRINVQVLFEILLRRTISAKIEFRLNAHINRENRVLRNFSSSSKSSSSSSSASSSFSSSASGQMGAKDRYVSKTEEQNKPNASGHQQRSQGSEASTSAFMSDSFPSPQLSLFLRKLKPELHAFARMRGNEYMALPSKSTIEEQEVHFSRHTTRTPHRKLAASTYQGISSGSSPFSHFDHSPMSMDSEAISSDYPLGNADMSLLQPFARSHTTLSLNTVSGDGFFERGDFYQSSGDLAFNSSFSASSMVSVNNHRRSRSTARTSISRELNLSKANEIGSSHARRPETGSSIMISRPSFSEALQS